MLKDDRFPHMKRATIVLRIFHLVTAPVALIATFFMLRNGYGPLYDNWSGKTVGADCSCIIGTFICLYISIEWIKMKERNGKRPETGFDWLISLGRRASFLTSSASSGVLLAYIGGAWPIWMLASTEIVSVLTYPSDKRLFQWLEEAKRSVIS